MIDLHCHSLFSDGALSPEELLAKARDKNLLCLSLTDHDTIAGYTELDNAAKGSSITIINGIELSTRWKKYDIHILGYHIKPTVELAQLIEYQNQVRTVRAQEIGHSLEKIGVEQAYEKACMLAGHTRIGRPHFAQVLVNEQKTKEVSTAFKQFLGRGKMAYVPTFWMSIADAVSGICQAGGQAVLAHPLKYGLTRSKLHALINEFKEAGGEGIEVVSGAMNSIDIHEMAGLSLRFNLLASSGSDFHSNSSPVSLGCQPSLPANCTPIWDDWAIKQGAL